MYKGADLMAWAERQALAWLEPDAAYTHPVAGASFARPALAVVIAEAYLRGAIDALADETDVKRLDRATAAPVAATDAGG